MLMLIVATLVPWLASACCTGGGGGGDNMWYWTTICAVDNATETGRCVDEPPPYLWVGIRVNIVTGIDDQCLCGAQIPNNVGNFIVDKVEYVWTCKAPNEKYRPIVFGNPPQEFTFELSQAAKDRIETQFGIMNVIGFMSPGQLTIPPTVDPPMERCPSAGGWIPKLWFRVSFPPPVARRLVLTPDGEVNRPNNFVMRSFCGGTIAGHLISDVTPPDNVVVCGDVHFTTLDNVRYTFNAAGDYVYLRTKKPHFDLHVRTKMLDTGSVLAAIAVRDAVSNEVIELWWHGEAAQEMIVNGRKLTAGEDEQENTVITFGDGVEKVQFGRFHIVKDSVEKSVSVRNDQWGPQFEIKANYGGKSSFYARIPEDWETEGLGGSKNGNQLDDLCYREMSRDGCLSLKATSVQVHDFGLSWKVSPHELLFQHWMSVKPEELKYKRLPITEEQLDEASKLCFGDQMCVYDYLSTGDLEFARHTLQDSIAYANRPVTYVGDDLVLRNSNITRKN
jgi:hypothetical protein